MRDYECEVQEELWAVRCEAIESLANEDKKSEEGQRRVLYSDVDIFERWFVYITFYVTATVEIFILSIPAVGVVQGCIDMKYY